MQPAQEKERQSQKTSESKLAIDARRAKGKTGEGGGCGIKEKKERKGSLGMALLFDSTRTGGGLQHNGYDKWLLAG